MARFRKTFCLLVACAWQLVSRPTAHAYEDQASVDGALGYVLLADSDSLPMHGGSGALGATLGLSTSTAARAEAAYLSMLESGRLVSAGRVRVEALYLFDVLQVVPFFGLGASLLVAESRPDRVQLRPGAHAVLGADYLLSRTWTLGLDVRSGLSLEGRGLLSSSDVSLRVSRMFETF